ncbi:MAG: D-tyrosyl-tRNA(Tyr) deacylase [Planctomycetes bacterium]|nr:D-tyrosyl-tRNA(Tyr) deacylase [Planctomycetota bacterium]
MRAVLQRVARAAVRIDGAVHSEIGRGILILLGVEVGDGVDQLEALAKKIAGLRIFDDAAGKMNLSNEEVGGAYLVVSQFTLLADLAKGKRPGFERALRPPEAEAWYERFCARLAELTGGRVERGKFGASMQVELVNDGPATFLLEYRAE